MFLSYHSVMYLIPVLHLLPLITASNNLPPYAPTDLILLNCGASSSSITPDGRNWLGDAQLKFQASNSETSSSAFTASEQDPSVPAVPYMTARIFHSAFIYNFPLSPGPKFVRLYFYGASYSNLDISHSFFSLKANSYTLLNNFSAFLTVSAIQPSVSYLKKEFVITVEENIQMLNITFSPSPKSFAFINGIEIVSMPNGLYAKDSDSPVIFVGSDTYFYFDSTTTLETVYRLNVGGGYIDGINDTGMYRTWLQDSDFIFPAAPGGVVSIASDTTIQYTRNTPAFVAPALVYSTMRYMGSNPHVNLNYNLTWILSVDAGFNYLVRLHFCETRIEVKLENEVAFFIFINNQTAESQADTIVWSGGNSFPVYKDYILWIPNGNRNKQDLWLALHPNMMSKPVYADAFLNGLEMFKLNNSDGSLAGPNPELTAVPSPPQQQQISVENKKSKGPFEVRIVIGAISAGILGLSSIICLFLLQRKWKLKEKSFKAPFSSITSTSALPTHRCHRFTITAIQGATENFDDKNIIGAGGFGTVYKGYIENGPIRPVAVKRLDSSSKQGTKEFRTELEMLSQLRHANLVSFIGYCIDEGEMILVYDYMINGTLRQHLYDTNNDPLPWNKRLEICIGAARGLHYLHSELKHTIIHRDVKTTNILLDEKWIAKVSDFGMAKEAFSEEVSTIVKGTWGYLDPEYARYKQLTQKSDVYSFGVVLFEVLCARKPVNPKLEEEQMNLVNWAKKCIQNGTFCELIDPYLRGRIATECLRKFVMIALSCVRNKGIDRPTMYDVKGELEFALELQEAVDFKKEFIDANGKYFYPEPEVSYFAAQLCTDIVSVPQLESIESSGSTTCATTATSLQAHYSNESASV